MNSKCALAAMEMNANVDREQATDSSGAQRWRVKVDRSGRKFTAQAVKQEKCNAYKRDLVDMVRYYISKCISKKKHE